MMKKINVCIACSAGGHLTEVLQLKESWQGKKYFFVSDRRSNALLLSKKEKVYFVEVPRKNPIKLIINFFQALNIFLKEKPDVIISTGADVAIPLILIAKVFGKKIIFIESFARIQSPSLSGKICYPLADLFFVQWKENLKFFPKARFKGAVF